MPDFNGGLVKKQLPIIFLIDTSGSMSGARIASVNDAMRDSIKVLKEKSAESADFDIKIGVLQFSTGASWVTNGGLVDLEHFAWNDLTASGLTDFGFALQELVSKLSKSAFFSSSVGYTVPVIICLSDGQPTDNWLPKFEELKKKNAWFRGARKVCIAVGAEADCEMLGRFCGNPKEGIIQPGNLASLESFIVAVSATASMMGQSQMVDENGNSVENSSLIKSAIEAMGDASNIDVIPNPIESYGGDEGFDIEDSIDDSIWD